MPIMLFLIVLGVYLHSLALLSTFGFFAFLVLAAGLIETMHPYMGLFHLLERSHAAIERINEIKNAGKCHRTFAVTNAEGVCCSI